MVETGIDAREIAVPSGNRTLAGRFYAPLGRARAHLLLHGATGVPQRYYRAFATWAAGQGIGVLSYDYRDFGASRTCHPRNSQATLADWCIADQAAAEAALLALAPEGPLWLLGHSLGGLAFPFRRHDPRIERVTTIGSGFVHVTDHPWSYRPTVLAFWYLLGPAATALAGYLPGRRLLLGADLPACVYWQWRRWCVSRDFFRADIGRSLPKPDFSARPCLLRMLSISDDVVVPPRAVRRYADAFPVGSVDYRMLVPERFGLKSLRHIEVLLQHGRAAWPDILGLPQDVSDPF